MANTMQGALQEMVIGIILVLFLILSPLFFIGIDQAFADSATGKMNGIFGGVNEGLRNVLNIFGSINGFFSWIWGTFTGDW